MRRHLPVLLCLVLVASSPNCFSQINSLQQLLLNASQAFARNGPASSIVLSGQLERVVGPDHENGTVTMTVRADGSSSVQMQLSSGERSEIQDAFAKGHGCSWSGTDGIAHSAAAHNCIMPLAWPLPEVTLFSSQLPPSGSFSIGSTSEGSNIVLHWAKQMPTANAEQARLFAHIGSCDLTFDASSFLPTSFSYAVYPDDSAGVDIPVLIRYSDYQTINGVAIPFHIERFFNGVLSLDITLSTAVVNN